VKTAERASKNRELSRDIERRRRLLKPEDGIRIGPPPEDPANMYDYYAIKVQCVIRGFIARCWIKWFRAMSIRAATMLQSAMRGWFGRMRVRRIRKYYNAARVIQKNFRGWFTRVSLGVCFGSCCGGRSLALTWSDVYMWLCCGDRIGVLRFLVLEEFVETVSFATPSCVCWCNSTQLIFVCAHSCIHVSVEKWFF
jgi:hypothetical protein